MDTTTDHDQRNQASEIFYDVVMRRLDEQMQRVDSLDTKTAQVFSISSAVLPIFGALLTFAGEIGDWALASLVIAAILYLALGVFVFLAYRVRSFSLRPDLEDLMANCGIYDDTAMRSWVAKECLKSIDANEKPLSRKAKYTHWSIALFALLSAALVFASLLTLM